jgi:hypothetical protein
MTNKARAHVPQTPTQNSISKKVPWIYEFGPYRYCVPAQDQGRIEFQRGRMSGIFTPNPEDSQSDYTSRSLDKGSQFLWTYYIVMHQLEKNKLNLFWEPKYSLNIEEPSECGEDVSEIETDAITDEVSQWTSSQLASAILNSQAESDMLRLREMILLAEDTSFTVKESEKLAPWLLKFAEKYRDSDDPQNEAAVWSAIRTGASMLHPQDTECLSLLLEPGHRIETSLVTVKMLGRIFEAQPPMKLDEYENLAGKVYQIAELVRNPYAIASPPGAAMAHLAIYALVAMANSKTGQIIEAVRKLNVMWFTRRTTRKLHYLRSTWASHPRPVPQAPHKLLDEALQILEQD